MLVTSPMFIFPGKGREKSKKVYVKPLTISDPFHSNLASIPKTTQSFQERIVSCPNTHFMLQHTRFRVVWYSMVFLASKKMRKQ